MKPVESLGISARLDGANGYFDPYQESNMKTSNAFRTAGALGALAVTQIALVSGASAQATAVQWRVEDGGNGHWYRFDPTHVNWEVTRSAAMAAGGDLACVGSQSENAFVRSLIPRDDAGYIGAIRTSNGWQWVSGETWNHESWNPGEPNGATVGEVVWLEHNSGVDGTTTRRRIAFKAPSSNGPPTATATASLTMANASTVPSLTPIATTSPTAAKKAFHAQLVTPMTSTPPASSMVQTLGHFSPSGVQ
jgi:hypothetical protein